MVLLRSREGNWANAVLSGRENALLRRSSTWRSRAEELLNPIAEPYRGAGSVHPGREGRHRMEQRIRYAKNGRLNIAYQVLGEGPVDLVLSPGWVTHLDLSWQIPPVPFLGAPRFFLPADLVRQAGNGTVGPEIGRAS